MSADDELGGRMLTMAHTLPSDSPQCNSISSLAQQATLFSDFTSILFIYLFFFSDTNHLLWQFRKHIIGRVKAHA